MQILTARIERDHAAGLSALDLPRAQLVEAAQAVSSWSVGTLEKGEAIRAVELAFEALSEKEDE